MTDEQALADGAIDEQDVALLQRLAAVWTAADPVPAGLVERLEFGVTLDALHAEIAQLQRMNGLVGARSTSSEVESVTFTSKDMTTMVTIAPDGPDRVRIDGWIAPGGNVAVELRTEDGRRQVVADDDGRFVFTDVPHGLAQFVLRAPGDPAPAPVVTPSIEL